MTTWVVEASDSSHCCLSFASRTASDSEHPHQFVMSWNHLRPLNLPTYYLFINIGVYVYAYFAQPYPTSLPGRTGKRRLGVDGYTLVSGWSEIAISNCKLKSALKCTMWSQCTPVADRRTDGQTDKRHLVWRSGVQTLSTRSNQLSSPR